MNARMNRTSTARIPLARHRIRRIVPNRTTKAVAPTLRPRASIVRRLEEKQLHGTAKAILDYLLSAILALPCLVVVAIAAVLVRLTSRGPAIYSQTRLGQFGRPFTIFKLRTMRHDCEADGGAKWSNRGDPRVTGLGRILRTLHIDELPQLVNVWRGEMSLIGPRPERPEIVVALRGEIPGYDRRLAVLPGVTGFAQVHLPPDVTTDCVRRKLVFDRYYVRFASWTLDVKILFHTWLKVLGLRRLYARSSSGKSFPHAGRQ